MTGFSAQVDQHDEQTMVIQLQGHGSFEHHHTLGTVIHEALSKKPKRLVVDMSGLNYVASLFMGQLIQASSHAKAQGCEICLAALSDKLDELIRVLGLHRYFTIYRTVAEACGRD